VSESWNSEDLAPLDTDWAMFIALVSVAAPFLRRSAEAEYPHWRLHAGTQED